MTDDNETNIGGVNLSNISDSTIQTGDISTTITAGGDVVGRDKIINNITQLKERALTAAEAADKAQAIARQRLAEAVTAYVERIGQIAADEQDALQGGPYRGLKAYTLGEAEIFFGRDEAMAALLAHLQRGRLTILHAESGAGKSSLLQAGIQYQLIVQGHIPLYLRPYDKSPAQAIKQALLPGLDSLPELAKASLREYLHQVITVLGSQTILVILIDQFEELFFTLNEEARRTFVEELAACLADESLNVRWVLALRTEFFGNLANFRPRIRNPFENDFRLNRLPAESARVVITEPARQVGISYEPTLLDTLLDDLRDSDSGEVAPPQIQLVCSALYNVLLERQRDNPDLPPTITLQMYEEEGRAEGILRGHLNRVLRRTLNPQEREAARQLLIALVSSDQRRIRRTKSDLAATLATYLTTAMSLDGLLDQLVESRLLNVEEDEQSDEPAYELAHDYLLTEIEIDPETQARKAAEELLKQEVEAFKRHGTLLSVDKFDIINSQREFLTLDDDAAELLRLSQAARRRAQIRRYGIVGAFALLIVGAAIGFAFLQQRLAAQAETAALRQAALAETAQAERDRAIVAENLAQAKERLALAAEETAQAEAQKAKQQEQRAETQATLAQSAQATAEAERNEAELARHRTLAVQSETLLNNDPQLAALIALESQRFVQSDEAERVLAKAQYKFPPIEATLLDHTLAVLGVAWSPDGSQLASGAADHTVRIWDLETSRPVTLKGHSDWVREVTWSPDGKQLASASDDKAVKVWNIAEQTSIDLTGHQDFILSLDWSPDGKYLASGDRSGRVNVWNMTASPLVTTPLAIEHSAQVWGLAWSPNSLKLATASQDQTIVIWDFATSPPLTTSITGHTGIVWGVAWSPDGTQLASAANDRDVIIWDVQTREPLRKLEGHRDGVYDVAWSGDGTRLASGSFDQSVIIWDTSRGEQMQKFERHTGTVWSVDWSPDSRKLASGSNDKTVLVWDMSPNQSMTLTEHNDSVFSARWSPDGSRLASTSADETVIIRNRTTNEPSLILDDHSGLVIEADWNPDGTQLASASWDGSVIIWDGFTGDLITRLEQQQPSRLWSVDWSPVGDRIAAGSQDNSVVVWDVSDRNVTTPITTLLKHTGGRVLDVAWSPDAHFLASASDDSTVIIWDTESWSVVGEPLDQHEGNVFSVAWSPDNEFLATGADDDRAILWRVGDWKPISVLTGHTAKILDIAWNNDGTLLASASGGDDDPEEANKIIVWDVATQKPITTLKGHEWWIWSVEWSPDQTLLTSASDDRTIQLLNTKFLQHPCKWLTRNLAYGDWQKYLPDFDYPRTCQNLPLPSDVIEDAKIFARRGLIEEAISRLNHLTQLDPTLAIDAEAEAHRIFQETVNNLVIEGQKLAWKGNVEAAITKFKEAKQLDPNLPFDDPEAEAQRLAQPTFENALDAAVQLAGQGDDETVKTKFEEAMELAASLNLPEVWHSLCVEGGLWQQAEVVLDACDNAIELEPENGQFYNSRAFVRQQLGDMAGAREDLAIFEQWSQERLSGP